MLLPKCLDLLHFNSQIQPADPVFSLGGVVCHIGNIAKVSEEFQGVVALSSTFGEQSAYPFAGLKRHLLGAARRLVIILPALLLPLPAMAADSAGPLAPHEAEYSMRLNSAKPSSGIVGANGVMRYSFSDSCDGWTVETHTELTLWQTAGGATSTVWDFVSWEAKDGSAYRFKVRNHRDGDIIDSYEGDARIGPDGVGSATFRDEGEGGESVVFDLSPGTLFPTSHTESLIRQARDGKRFFARKVFDGSAIGEAINVSAAIGARFPGDSNSALPNLLLNTPGWPVVLAFFSPDNASGTPDFEVTLRYHDNGVAESILQDFGDFTLRGTLTDLRSPLAPKC